MESLARRGIRLARASSRMGSLKQNAQLVAGQNSVPLHALQGARTVAAVVFDELGGPGKSVPGAGANDPGRLLAVSLGPRGDQPAEVNERVADGGEFPIDDGGEFCAIVAVHYIG